MQRSPRDNTRARVSSAGSCSTSSGCTAKTGDATSDDVANSTSRNRSEPSRRIVTPPAATPPAAIPHPRGPEPDQQDERLVIDPPRDRAVRIGIAERDVELAQSAGHQRG